MKKNRLSDLTGFKEICQNELVRIGGKGACSGYVPKKKSSSHVTTTIEYEVIIVPPPSDPSTPKIPEQPVNGFIPAKTVTVASGTAHK